MIANKTFQNKPRVDIASSIDRESVSINALEDLSLQVSCFYTEISRIQAEDVLKRYSDQPGTFLIRSSTTFKGYAITVVIAENQVGHVLVHSPNRRCFYAEDSIQFENMSDLINYYKSCPLPIVSQERNSNVNAKLSFPLRRFRQRQPLPYQRDFRMTYDFVKKDIVYYSEVADNAQGNKTFDQPESVIFYEEGEKIVLAPAPVPPRNNRRSFETCSPISCRIENVTAEVNQDPRNNSNRVSSFYRQNADLTEETRSKQVLEIKPKIKPRNIYLTPNDIINNTIEEADDSCLIPYAISPSILRNPVPQVSTSFYKDDEYMVMNPLTVT